MATKKEFGDIELLKRLDASDDILKLAEEGKLTEDAFNKEFEAIWISREAAKKDQDIYDPIVKMRDAETYGKFEKEMKRSAETFGLEFTKEELNPDGKLLRAIDLPALLTTKIQGVMDELKENASKGNDEKVTKLQSKLEEHQGQISHFKGEFEKKTLQFEELEKSSANNLVDYKINTKLSQSSNRIPFKSDISDIEREGFNSIVGSLEKELDENDNLILKKDGEQFWNEAKTENLSADETVLKIANDNKLVKKNAIEKVIKNNNGRATVDPDKVLRKVHTASADAKHNDM